MALNPVFYHLASGVGKYSSTKTAASQSASSDDGLNFASVLGSSLTAQSATSATAASSTASPQKLTASSPLVLASHLWGSVTSTGSLFGSSAASSASSSAKSGSTSSTQSSTDEQEQAEAKPLGQAISSYSGERFEAEVSRSKPEKVGSGIDQFHFPHLVEKDGLYYAYFIDHSGGSENDVGLAISSDGVNFDYQGKVLTKGDEFDDAQASFPGVAYDEDTQTWYMLYEGKSVEGDVNSVCLATSQDGVNWEKQGPIISPNDAGEISNVDVGTPTLFKENGVWHVYFHTFATDGRVRIGYASGEDLTNLTVKQGPLLDTDASGLEAGTVGARSNVVKVGEYYYMAYEVCEAYTDFGQAEWGTNLARAESPDGPWEKMDGPLLKNKGTGFGADGPELSVQDGKLYLYYRYGGNDTARVELTGLESGAQAMMAHQAA
ncbi:hypothetical protein AAU61_04925 [Desulfocarbo indianensis]|nr:hypothetical protein AAU61_04925 [Desulfocarbo indianensis]